MKVLLTDLLIRKLVDVCRRIDVIKNILSFGWDTWYIDFPLLLTSPFFDHPVILLLYELAYIFSVLFDSI